MIGKAIAIALLFCGLKFSANAQELYVFTEPASNMPTNSLAIRLTNEGMFDPKFVNRSILEAMVGLNKNLMFHIQGFGSNSDGKFKLEGSSIYAKYRFFSVDGEHSHSRIALFGRASTSNRKTYTEDINLEGDNAGFQAGLVFTQLIHKLAFSTTFGYNKANWKPGKQLPDVAAPDQMLNYSLSSGYLLLPFVYKNYNQPNLNLYFEMLGKTNPENGHTYIDFAPAVQVILNSRTRIDLGYRFQATGNLEGRYLKNMYLARIELNFFNVFNNKE
jgi:hypothetical protein